MFVKWKYFIFFNQLWSLCGVMGKVLVDCGFEISDFGIQSCLEVHFQRVTQKKSIYLIIFQVLG